MSNDFSNKVKKKYYIILQPSIRAMGGEEMYTRNIIVSAHQQGYEPIVFHSGIGGDRVYIEDLKTFTQNVFHEFRYEPCVISKRKKNQLINRIKTIINDYDEDSIIESHEILVAEWGEWIASQLRIRHFAYMLLEHNTLSYKPVYDFFKFKYDRRELAGIAKATIPDMFAKYDNNIEGYFLPAFCSNVYENILCPKEFKVGDADYTIGSIGRTNKQYVQPMIDAIIRFVTKYNDKSFNILYIGGSMDKASEEKVFTRLSSLPNAVLLFTGMLFPISIEMIRQMDVCVASSGSCLTSYNCGIPTISVDANDSKAIGVFNETTSNFLFRNSNEPPLEIENLLEEILIKKKYQRVNRKKSIDVDFSSHWEFVSNMSSKKEYFNIEKIVFPFKRRIIARFLGFYYGLKPTGYLYRFLSKMVNFLHK